MEMVETMENQQLMNCCNNTFFSAAKTQLHLLQVLQYLSPVGRDIAAAASSIVKAEKRHQEINSTSAKARKHRPHVCGQKGGRP
jgi:hypothetical protein